MFENKLGVPWGNLSERDGRQHIGCCAWYLAETDASPWGQNPAEGGLWGVEMTNDGGGSGGSLNIIPCKHPRENPAGMEEKLSLQCFAVETDQGDMRVGLSSRESGSQNEEVMGVDACGGESLRPWPPSSEGEHAGREPQNQEETRPSWETASPRQGRSPVGLRPVRGALACGSHRPAAPPAGSASMSRDGVPTHTQASPARTHLSTRCC